jgi:hypothetical protein
VQMYSNTTGESDCNGEGSRMRSHELKERMRGHPVEFSGYIR